MKMAKPLPWSPEDRIHIPELAPIFGGDPNVPASLLGKNCLVTGETGSGKSQSFVIPMLKGLLRHRADDFDHRFALLVVDPKRELLDIVRSEIGDSDRQVVLGDEGSPLVDFHEGTRDKLSVTEAFDQALEALCPGAKKSTRTSNDNAYWQASGMALARQLVDLVATVEQSGHTMCDLLARRSMWQDPPTAPPKLSPTPAQTFLEMALHVGGFFRPNENSIDAYKHRITMAMSVIKRLATTEQCSSKGAGAGVAIPDGRRDALRLIRLVRRMAKSQKWPAEMLEEHLAQWMRAVESSTEEIIHSLWGRSITSNPFAQPIGQKLMIDSFLSISEPEGASWYAQPAGILTGILASLRVDRGRRFDSPPDETQAIGDALRRIARYVGRPDLAESMGNIGAADVKTMYWHADVALGSFLKPLLDRDVATRLHLNPVFASDKTISIQHCVENGKVVVFQPKLLATDADDAFAKTLKQHFFRATMSRENRERGVGYIVDEAHRYISTDEANWVDVCRAYRGITCFATQSVASIRLALAKQDSDLSSEALGAAIQVLATNLSNKLFFRSSDMATRDLLRSLIPVPPGTGPHVVDVRPPTTLRVGECYALTADGGWSRKQVKLPEVEVEDDPESSGFSIAA